jgi:hypothetical protein
MLTEDTTIGDNRLKGLLKSQPDHPIFRGGHADYRALAIKDKMFAMMGPDLDKLTTGYVNNSVRRYENQINMSALVRKVSRGVVKATGADWWTTNGRQGWQTSMLNFLAPQGGKAFDKLPEATREHFMRYYGLAPANWDTIRQAPPMIASNGAKYIDPNALPAPLSERLMAAIKEQGSSAFHQPTRGRRRSCAKAQPRARSPARCGSRWGNTSSSQRSA